jgi:hypothetical protein
MEKEYITNSMGTVGNNNTCYLDADFTIMQKIRFIFHGSSTLAAFGPFIVWVSTSHLVRNTQSVGIFWTSVRPSQRCPWQHTTVTWDKHPCPGRDSNLNPSRREAANRSLRPQGLRDLHKINLSNKTRLTQIIRERSENFSASTIDGNTIGKIYFSPKSVHLSSIHVKFQVILSSSLFYTAVWSSNVVCIP